MHAVTPNVPETYMAKTYQICEDELHQHKNQWGEKTPKPTKTHTTIRKHMWEVGE